MVYRLALPEDHIADATYAAKQAGAVGGLTEAEALQRSKVERALVDVVLEWARRWLRHA